jgi:hypothetical protein
MECAGGAVDAEGRGKVSLTTGAERMKELL